MKVKIKLTIMLAILMTVFILSFAVGKYSINPFDVIKILLSKFLNIKKTWSDNAQVVIFQIRMPRIIAAVLIGSALSVAGCVYQGLFKNHMVSPEVLGASNGAGFGAALGIFFSLGYVKTTALSFVMGLIAVCTAYLISEKSRGDKNFSMILSGIIVGSLFSAMISFLKLIADTENTLPAITYWLMGSLASIKIGDVICKHTYNSISTTSFSYTVANKRTYNGRRRSQKSWYKYKPFKRHNHSICYAYDICECERKRYNRLGRAGHTALCKIDCGL